jgi:hypothetical protein
LEKEVRTLRKQLEQSQGHVTALEEKLHRREKDMQLVQDDSIRMEMEHSLTRTLLEARILELKGAQSFLTTADALSEAEVSSMVDALNAEIFQAAASMADSFEFEIVKGDAGEALTTTRRKTEEVLGPRMLKLLKLLSSLRHREDLLVVQIALQAWVTKFGRQVITVWHSDVLKEQSFLEKVYSQTRGAGKVFGLSKEMMGLNQSA